MPAKKVTYELPKGCKELSLRPYPGRLFAAKTRAAYLSAHKTLFGKPDDELEDSMGGRFSMDVGKDGSQTYLIWAETAPFWAHELAHVILYLFSEVGITSRDDSSEPFCYLIQTLMEDVLGW